MHQKDSWEDFVKNGLREVFAELNPIDDYTGKKMSLRFKDYYFKDPKESEHEAKYNLATYEAPLHVLVELENKVNCLHSSSFLDLIVGNLSFRLILGFR